ncbi:MAG: hypothetical protein R3E97_16630 [Candidatus Eisenbacteria bacterium]
MRPRRTSFRSLPQFHRVPRLRSRSVSSALLPALLLTASAHGVASGGPNEGGTLILHESEAVYSTDHSGYCGQSGLSRCTDANTRVDGGGTVVFHALAAFSPGAENRLAGVVFGVDYEPDGIVLLAWGGCGDFELWDSDWPAPGTGTAVTWGNTQTADLVEVYWFAGYNYDFPNAHEFALGPHPSQGSSFADDSVPSNLDEIAGLGTLGFGRDGFAPCPDPLGLGACCYEDGRCELSSFEDCESTDGQYQGLGRPCDPNPCLAPGACCHPNGLCELVAMIDCDDEFLGEGSTCEPNPCPLPGACCAPDGACTVVLERLCSGDFLGEGTTCVPNPCLEPGACCHGDGSCSFVLLTQCSGDFLGTGIPCDPNPCIVDCWSLRRDAVAHVVRPAPPQEIFGRADRVPGPNTNGALLLHHEASVVYTSDQESYCGASSIRECAEANSRVDGVEPAVLFLLASFPTGMQPRVAGVTFGIDYDVCVIPLSFGACGDFELADPYWPGSGRGTAVVWAEAQTESLIEVYWFAAYSVYGDPQLFSVVPHPAQGGWFADDSTPSRLDAIMGYGTMGFGTDGHLPCPVGPTAGACCLSDGSCTMLTPAQCDELGGVFVGYIDCDVSVCSPPAGACCVDDIDCIITTLDDCALEGGIYRGDGSTCDPNPCVPVPTRSGTWGSIKAMFR